MTIVHLAGIAAISRVRGVCSSDAQYVSQAVQMEAALTLAVGVSREVC